MTRQRLCLLVLGVVLATAGLIGHGIAAQPHRLIKIGALTESWGPNPAIVGLRDGLQELGYREDQDFVLGVRFTQGNPAELPAAARALVKSGVDLIVASGVRLSKEAIVGRHAILEDGSAVRGRQRSRRRIRSSGRS